jgi:hypothetical protein
MIPTWVTRLPPPCASREAQRKLPWPEPLRAGHWLMQSIACDKGIISFMLASCKGDGSARHSSNAAPDHSPTMVANDHGVRLPTVSCGQKHTVRLATQVLVTFLRHLVRLDEPVKPSTTRRAAWSICITSLVLVVATVVVYALNGFAPVVVDWGTAFNPIAFAPVTIAFPIVGVLIAVRRPDNAVGWLCLFIGLANAVSGFAGDLGGYLFERDPGGSLAVFCAWFSSWSSVLYVASIGVFLPLLFPNGKLPSRRWSPVLWVGVAATTLASLGVALDPGPLGPPPFDIRNPYALENTNALLMVFGFGSVLVPLCFVAAGASMVVRFRRSRGVERQQLKWFVYAAAVLAGLFAVEMAILIVRGTTGLGAQRVLEDVVTAAFAAPAIAAGIAILRYRLYDIDVLINRTLVYASLTVVLGVVYVVGVLGIGGLLRGITGQSNSLVVAISTMVVAALFRPARGRIQGSVDRYFYRGKYDAVKTLDGFLARVREEVALDALLDDLTATVQETMQPRHVSVWLKR